jgi:hypothetical protein
MFGCTAYTGWRLRHAWSSYGPIELAVDQVTKEHVAFQRRECRFCAAVDIRLVSVH